MLILFINGDTSRILSVALGRFRHLSVRKVHKKNNRQKGNIRQHLGGSGYRLIVTATEWIEFRIHKRTSLHILRIAQS